MRCAVPSSKVGSCDSASAAAERDSGVDAAPADLPGVVRAAAAPPVGASAAGLAAGAGLAVPGDPAFWARAGVVASKRLTARIVVVRISKIPGMRKLNQRFGLVVKTEGRERTWLGKPTFE